MEDSESMSYSKKGKDINSVSSWRPISLLPNTSKVFEALIKDKLQGHISRNKLMPEQQYGFQHKLSTTHAVNSVTTNINKHLKNNNFVGAALIDLEKAFDSVWLEGLLYKLCQKKFPEYLILLIWDMIVGKNFFIRGTDPDSLFFLHHGVQQGSVTGPVLFNIFFSDLLLLYDLNKDDTLTAVMFADDLIVQCADKNSSIVKTRLNEVCNNVNSYCKTWHLNTNISKCETILFRPPLVNISTKNKKNYKEFSVQILDTNTNTMISMPHKKTVKYLGIYLDELMRLVEHCKTQLTKAKNAFHTNSKLFFSSCLNTKAKTICYMLLIRPILTYGAPIWFNSSASTIEKMRSFERACLRAITGLHRTPESNYKKYHSNKVLYNAVDIPRIDVFIINLIRNFWINTKHIDHDQIQNQLQLADEDALQQCNKGYTTPSCFLYLDKMGVMQNSDNTPELYHISRHARNKKIFHQNLGNTETVSNKYRYSKTIPEQDRLNNSRFINKCYWWLNSLDDVRKRTRRK